MEARFKAAGFFGYWPLLSLPVPRPAPRWTQQPHAWVNTVGPYLLYFSGQIFCIFFTIAFFTFFVLFTYIYSNYRYLLNSQSCALSTRTALRVSTVHLVGPSHCN